MIGTSRCQRDAKTAGLDFRGLVLFIQAERYEFGQTRIGVSGWHEIRPGNEDDRPASVGNEFAEVSGVLDGKLTGPDVPDDNHVEFHPLGGFFGKGGRFGDGSAG